MKLLIVSPLAYYPGCGNGGGLICFRLLQGLASRHQIIFVGFSDLGAAEQAQAREALQQLCMAVHILPVPNKKAFGRLRARVRQWLGGPPVDADAFDAPEMHATLAEVLTRERPEIAILQFPYMAQYAGDLRGSVPVLMDVQDVFFVSRLREYARQLSRWTRLKRLVAWVAWTRHEMKWYRRCDRLMALTEQDCAALGALVPDVPAFVNHPAIAERPFIALPPSAPRLVGFAGSFDHPPNRDALLWLGTEIAPLLIALHPGAQIVVAGRSIPDALRARLHPAVHCLGYVADYDSFMRSCCVLLAPLRSGGGIKIKVLDALACARPVVTTPIGAEGIALGPEHGLQVGRSAAELAALVAAHLEDPAPGAAAAACGAQAVALRFGVAGAVACLEQEFVALRLAHGAAAQVNG